MARRTVTAFPFGAGIDRTTGEAATGPGQFRDLRNVVLKEGKAEARKGLESLVSITMSGAAAAATDLMHLGMYRATNRGVLVPVRLGASSTQAVEVWRTATNGLNPVFCAGWTFPSAPVAPVQVFGVESYAKYLLAHDDPDIARRAVTKYLNTSFALASVQANLDGTGTKDVKFRGVARYLNYAVGWGFGTDADKDRPEVLRVSMPGDPLAWDANHYFICGPRTEAILNVAGMQDHLLVLKETELYVVTGYDRTTFAVRLMDPTYGLAGSHLAATVDGLCYFWSHSGPRVYAGGPSEDLGLPLDLGGPDPAGLAASGDVNYGWAIHDPDQKLVLFAFPDRSLNKTRTYCLSVRDPQNPRWSYIEFQKALMTAGQFFAAVGGAPSGYPDIGTLAATADTLTVPWTNVTAVGDETVEVWVSVASGAYTRWKQVTVSGSSQQVVLTVADGPLTPGSSHSVALRYRRGIEYTSGYSDPVTSGWTATPISQSVDSISVPAAPAAPSSISETACDEVVVGGKTYSEHDFQWTPNLTVGVGHYTDLLESTTNDPATATVVASVAIDASPETLENYGWLKSPGGSSTPRYLWLRNRLSTGEVSSAVALPDSPYVPSEGCTV